MNFALVFTGFHRDFKEIEFQKPLSGPILRNARQIC